jgi:hypothetical protein
MGSKRWRTSAIKLERLSAPWNLEQQPGRGFDSLTRSNNFNGLAGRLLPAEEVGSAWETQNSAAPLHHDGNVILAELDIWEAIIDFAPMAPIDR